MIRCILALLLTTFSVGAASLPIQYEEAFFSAKKIVTSGGGGGSGSGFTLLFKDGACGTVNITNAANATTGGTLFVMAVASDNANAGTITVGGDPALTFVAGTPKGFASTFSNQMFYCTNFTPNGAQKFWAHSSASGNLGFLVRAYSGGSQPALFDGEVGTTAATAMTIQPAAFTPSQGELIIESLSYDGGTASIDSGFSFPPDQPAFCANPAMSVLETNNTVHPTWSVGQNANLAATGMMFKTNAGGGGGSTVFVTAGHGSARNNFTGYVGFGFTVGAAGITVTDLGRMIRTGSTGSYVIYLCASDGSIITQTASLDPTGVTGDTYQFGSITPTSLTATGSYFILSNVSNGGVNPWYDDDSLLTTTADATITSSRFVTTIGSSPGLGNAGVRGYIPVNFKYTKP